MSLEELVSQAESGDVDAQYELAQKYYNGDEVERNIEKALHWYTKAAEQGDSACQYALACHYCREGKYKKAKYWVEAAIKNGHAITCKCLVKNGL
jgi:pentatricopeptide repeat protein